MGLRLDYKNKLVVFNALNLNNGQTKEIFVNFNQISNMNLRFESINP